MGIMGMFFLGKNLPIFVGVSSIIASGFRLSLCKDTMPFAAAPNAISVLFLNLLFTLVSKERIFSSNSL